jgi:hypothetical protein
MERVRRVELPSLCLASAKRTRENEKTLINQLGDSLPCPIFPDKSEKFFTFHLYQRANRPNQKGASGQVDDLGRQHIAKRLRIVALGIDLWSS